MDPTVIYNLLVYPLFYKKLSFDLFKMKLPLLEQNVISMQTLVHYI